MKTHSHVRSRVRQLAQRALPFALLAAVATPVVADDDSGATYGRIRSLDGALTIEQVSEGEVVEGSANSPVVPGDRVATTGGRAEIELADSSIVWMDSDSRIEFKTLADIQNRYERTNLLALIHGSIRVEIRDPGDPDAVFQIDTEAASIYLLSAGTFRIDAVGGITTVSSHGGVAEFSGDGGSVLVRSGQRSSVESGNDPSVPRRFNTQRQDGFDRYCADRADAFLRQGEDEGYGEDLPEEVRPYASELSFYGTWHTIPTYGRVWRPHYAGVWTPYHHGYWSWCRRNWVWVSYDPWGWAPYHYGRWDFAVDIGWFWMPGAVWGGGWVSFAVGPSYIGWCPLNYWNVPVFHDVWIVNRPTVSVGRLDPRGWQFVPAGRFGLRGSDMILRGDRLPRNTDLVVTQRLPQFDPRVIAKRPDRAAGLVDAARRTRVAPPVTQEPGGSLVPFRAIERRAPRGPIGHPAVSRPKSKSQPDPTPSANMPPGQSPGPDPRSPASPRGRTTTTTKSSPSSPSVSTPSRPSQRGETGRGNGPRSGRELTRDGGSKKSEPAPSQVQPPREPDRPRGHAMERLFEGTRTKPPTGSTSPPPGRVEPPRISDPPKASDPPRPSTPSRATAQPRRSPEKKPAAPNPPPRDDSPEPKKKRR